MRPLPIFLLIVALMAVPVIWGIQHVTKALPSLRAVYTEVTR